MIGIIGAMEEEVIQLKNKMQVKQEQVIAKMNFMQGILEGKEVVVVRSGIGKVNAAICAQILVNTFQVSTIINTGIAGSLNNDINIGDIVLSTDTIQHDVDARGFGYALGVIPRMEESTFIADAKLRELAKNVCEEVNLDITVFEGRVVSGDQFISDADVKKQIMNNFQPYCTEMEGAAIGQTAYLNNIPFLVIRAISDKADNSATVDYPTFEAKAIEHTVKLMTALIAKM